MWKRVNDIWGGGSCCKEQKHIFTNITSCQFYGGTKSQTMIKQREWMPAASNGLMYTSALTTLSSFVKI